MQVSEALTEAGLSKSKLEAALADIRGSAGGGPGGRTANTATAESQFAALEAYGVDLTARAAKLDPVIGREEEIRRCVRA